MSSKTKKIALPFPKPKGSGKGKVVVLVLLGVGLCFVVTDPAGSSVAVNDFLDSLATFGANLSGGGW